MAGCRSFFRLSNIADRFEFGSNASLSCCEHCGDDVSSSVLKQSATISRRPKPVVTSCRKSRCPVATVDRHGVKNVPIQHTDVIVIGNGPSGICLSYLLSGNWPYYTGAPHPSEILNPKLASINPEKSFIEQDLAFLSDGLEGRSSNPVALLFDALLNPDADIGAKLPSLVHWKFQPERAVRHVVLGKYDEGGIWQTIEDDIQTLSLGDWMQLPDMSFAEWRVNNAKLSDTDHDILSNRATAAEVRQYYSDYVDAKSMRQNFTNHATVTSVERVPDFAFRSSTTDCENGEVDGETGLNVGRRQAPLIWEVRGHRTVWDTGSRTTKRSEDFCYRAPTIVLATGLFDVPNKLCVRGENHPYVLHSLAELDNRIRSIDGDVGPDSDPVVIVGSGLSAADAILRVRAIGIPVAHVFRRDGNDPLATFRQLPPAIYPDRKSVV